VLALATRTAAHREIASAAEIAGAHSHEQQRLGDHRGIPDRRPERRQLQILAERLHRLIDGEAGNGRREPGEQCDVASEREALVPYLRGRGETDVVEGGRREQGAPINEALFGVTARILATLPQARLACLNVLKTSAIQDGEYVESANKHIRKIQSIGRARGSRPAGHGFRQRQQPVCRELV